MIVPQASPVLDGSPQPRAARKPSHISQALRSIQVNAAPPEYLGSEFEVRPILNDEELDQVYRITHDAFVETGFWPPQRDGRIVHCPHLDRIPETTVLAATLGGEIIGTISWTRDGPHGLAADSEFKAECDGIRTEGLRLGSIWRLATRSICRNDRNVVLSLIQETVHGVVGAGLQTTIITMNPRHEKIYRRMLNMTTVARKDSHGPNNPPAVLMRMNTDRVPQRWLSAAPLAEFIAYKE